MNRRYLMMLRMLLIKSPMKRAKYLSDKGVFRNCGNRVMISQRKIPLYPELISIGNNVWIASGVEFITHDVIHFMLNGLDGDRKYQEKIGCIEIGNNVFIGTGVKILYDVQIGSNVIIAAGAMVNKDVPDNSVVGGVPAKVIGTFDEFVAKRKMFHMDHVANNAMQAVSRECIDESWKKFNEVRKKGVGKGENTIMSNRKDFKGAIEEAVKEDLPSILLMLWLSELFLMTGARFVLTRMGFYDGILRNIVLIMVASIALISFFICIPRLNKKQYMFFFYLFLCIGVAFLGTVIAHPENIHFLIRKTYGIERVLRPDCALFACLFLGLWIIQKKF